MMPDDARRRPIFRPPPSSALTLSRLMMLPARHIAGATLFLRDALMLPLRAC
jgi:hypothetical protein